VTAACARLGLRFDPIDLPTLPEAVTETGCVRTTPALWPERGGMDGFFAARLIRP
jgi:16S rRNA (cytosine967-C5)-methyltransferase